MNNGTSNDLNELIQLSEEWDRVMVENDARKIGSFMANDWVIVATEGGITSKSSFLEYIKPGGLLHHRMEFEIIKIAIYGDTGIVVARGTSGGTYKEDAFSYYEWSTSIFHKSNNGWLCVLTMLTPANSTA